MPNFTTNSAEHSPLPFREHQPYPLLTLVFWVFLTRHHLFFSLFHGHSLPLLRAARRQSANKSCKSFIKSPPFFSLFARLSPSPQFHYFITVQYSPVLWNQSISSSFSYHYNYHTSTHSITVHYQFSQSFLQSFLNPSFLPHIKISSPHLVFHISFYSYHHLLLILPSFPHVCLLYYHIHILAFLSVPYNQFSLKPFT